MTSNEHPTPATPTPQPWTPEPWERAIYDTGMSRHIEITRRERYFTHDHYVAEIQTSTDEPVPPANAERIVACVNKLAGHPDLDNVVAMPRDTFEALLRAAEGLEANMRARIGDATPRQVVIESKMTITYARNLLDALAAARAYGGAS